jgi:hypothetical protein
MGNYPKSKIFQKIVAKKIIRGVRVLPHLKGALRALCVLRRRVAVSSCIPELRLEENGGGESKKTCIFATANKRGKHAVLREKRKIEKSELLPKPPLSPLLDAQSQPCPGRPSTNHRGAFSVLTTAEGPFKPQVTEKYSHFIFQVFWSKLKSQRNSFFFP